MINLFSNSMINILYCVIKYFKNLKHQYLYFMSNYRWRFNSSTHFATLPPEKFFTDRSKSVASYTPKNEIDYGTLSCWASNEVGDQKRPCIFHVIPAGE